LIAESEALVTIDQAEFRSVLGHFASGVAVISAFACGRPVGFTCQSFFSLSLDPPLVAMAPGRSSTSWPKIVKAERLCVNVLAAGQEALARVFAVSGADKFSGVGWSAPVTPSGGPRLHGALAWIDCVVEQVHEGGDHFLVVAAVLGLVAGQGSPLLFYRGGFGSFAA
jgi:3-hydroxy-9,10-secoandrosta-1,3,5(10)-triene-9,17-dione monooxygenase reductase component